MWVIYAFGSAFFAGMTSILVKCGLKKTNSTVAMAIRTIIVLIMSFFMVLIVGSLKDIATVSAKNWVFLVLSGIATGASWLCYFRAIQLGNVNKVAPIDKSSTILTILLAFIVLKEPVSWLQSICVCMIAAGTFMMIEKKDVGIVTNTSRAWLPYAAASAVFAALTSILGKVGISGVESNLGTMIRTIVVLFMSWLTVFATGKGKDVHGIPKGEMAYICVSGIATGASWRTLKSIRKVLFVPILKCRFRFSYIPSVFLFIITVFPRRVNIKSKDIFKKCYNTKKKNAEIIKGCKLTKSEGQADIKVYIVNQEYKADIKIMRKNFPKA